MTRNNSHNDISDFEQCIIINIDYITEKISRQKQSKIKFSFSCNKHCSY